MLLAADYVVCMAGQRPRLPEQLPKLTSRQEEVLGLIEKGRTNFEIAEALGISLEGAKYHVREIMARLGAGSREEAVALWQAGRRRRHLGHASWLRGVFVGISLRWAGVAVTGTMAAVAAVATVALVARGGSPNLGMEPNASPTPTQAAPTIATELSPTFPPANTPTRAPQVGPYPIGTRTGDAVLDAVIAAVEAGDANTLFGLIHYVPIACDDPNAGPVQPPGTFQCPNGEPDGTEIPALVAEGTDGWTLPEGDPEIPGLLADFMPADPRLYAIAGSPLGWEDVPPAAGLSVTPHTLVFATGQALIVDDVGVTTILQVPTDPQSRVSTATTFVLAPLPSGPAPYAGAMREQLFDVAESASLVNDIGDGYGIYSAWLGALPGLAIVARDQVPPPGGVSARSAGFVADSAPDDPPSAQATESARESAADYRPRVSFAVLDDAGNCAAGLIVIDLIADKPRGGIITISNIDVPNPCTAEAAAAGS